MRTETDVAIIGAGPVGLFAVFECGMVGLKACVIDALEQVGGQCAALYPEKPIYDIPAHPRVLGGELIEKLKEQAAPFNPTYFLGQRVEEIHRAGDVWGLVTSQGQEIHAKVVIIAAGAGAFGPNRPPLEGLDNFEGKSIFYSIPQKDVFKGKKVMIAGGGDSAIDWALTLSEFADVTVVHRRPKFRAAAESVRQLDEKVASGVIKLAVPYQLSGLEGDKDALSGVWLETLDGERVLYPADFLLPFYGLQMNLGPILQWGLDFDNQTLKVNPATCQTNQPGVYAIGDIISYPGKLKLILTGFSEAAIAAHAARSFIHPEQNFHFEYSTTSGVPNTQQ